MAASRGQGRRRLQDPPGGPAQVSSPHRIARHQRERADRSGGHRHLAAGWRPSRARRGRRSAGSPGASSTMGMQHPPSPPSPTPRTRPCMPSRAGSRAAGWWCSEQPRRRLRRQPWSDPPSHPTPRATVRTAWVVSDGVAPPDDSIGLERLRRATCGPWAGPASGSATRTSPPGCVGPPAPSTCRRGTARRSSACSTT